jgi:Domain of unknown function (DUF4129)
MALPDGQGGFAGSARGEARNILSGPQYHSHPEKTIDPLGGVLNAIGKGLGDVFDPIGRWLERHLFHPTASWFSVNIGSWWVYPVLALVFVLCVALALFVISRRSRPGRVPLFGRAWAESGGMDPDALDELAEKAQSDGDLELAIRLRFRAGLIRLDNAGAIARGPTRTNRELSRALGSETFDGLAADLDSIVYGGEQATTTQAERSRSGWGVVAMEADRSKAGVA